MEIYLALAIPILIATAWLYTAQLTRSSLPTLRNKRICLLIAHPDDEAMFFSPTILGLSEPNLGNHIKILCLSSGDADGLGEIRKTELQASAKTLGLRSASDVLVLEDTRFPDSMTASWPASAIARVLSSAFCPATNEAVKAASEGPSASIDVLITFDAHGVSSHPNHTSLYHGARAWLVEVMAGRSGWKCPVDMYTLTTTNIIRKYLSFLDAPLTMLVGGLRGSWAVDKKEVSHIRTLLFISGFSEWRKGQDAMVMGHKSQMRWFRWGWIGVGRYMVVNDLRRHRVV